MDITFLYDILIIFGISLLVGLIFNRFRLPPMIGFIVAGVIAGPYMLSLIRSPQQVDLLAELGIILLLFSIGLEFSFRQLWEIKDIVLKGGAIQVFLAAAITISATYVSGCTWNEAVVLGFVVSLSSTAVVLKVLHDRGELDSPHGKLALGILIFQDLIAIPMLMAIPFLASAGYGGGDPLYLVLIKDLFLIVILVATAKWIMPWLLFQVARTRSSELFLLFVISVCFGVAALASFAGLSLAMGALIAGLLISESEFSHQAIGRIVPFRDTFTAFFFVSIGMLLDVGFFIDNLWIILLFLGVIIILKWVTTAAAAAILGYQMRTIILAGIALAQIGEFSFIISRSALEFGILSHDVFQAFLIVALSTMALTPFLISSGPAVAGYICGIPLFQKLFPARCQWIPGEERVNRTGHLVIIGFGVNGQNLARAAKMGGITYTIIDMNPDSVKRASREGESIIYGDATIEGVLDHAGIDTARIAVVAINDPVATRRIVGLCRQKNPGIFLIVRTRYLIEVPVLMEIGADEVIPEEFETSIEIFTRVLQAYSVPFASVVRLVRDIRADSYQALRSRDTPTPGDTIEIPGMEVREVTVREGSPIVGQTLGGIILKKRYGVTVLAVRRDGALIPHPDGTCAIQAGDVLVLTGTTEKLEGSHHLFSG